MLFNLIIDTFVSRMTSCQNINRRACPMYQQHHNTQGNCVCIVDCVEVIDQIMFHNVSRGATRLALSIATCANGATNFSLAKLF